MVKTLHPLEAIFRRVSSADVHLVPLVRAVNVAGGVEAIVDPAAVVMRALAEPLEFPALAQTTVPGDRVAVTVDAAVPRAGEIVGGVIAALHAAGVEDGLISIVTTSGSFNRQCRVALENGTAAAIHSVIHDPDAADNLCLVAVPKRREPLRVNRTIFEADVVLPIGCARIDGCGVFDGLFPWFAGAETVERYRLPKGHDSAAARAKMIRETNEAGWLIGVPLVVNVVPGIDGSVAHVLAGEPRALSKRSAELTRRQWERRAPQRASLVVAVVRGGETSQTWANVGRALSTAQRLVEEGGAIAICTNLDQPLGPSLSRLVDCTDLEAARRKITHECFDDSWPAWQLARALEQGPVYFLSQLDSDTVEQMGMAPVADLDELVRLATRHESCIVLDDAQHTAANVDGEEHES